ncbi:MAG: PAS domain-containing protein [Deltaproteobacteria bacterium]|nr:MAG: PAS domain-containing protein [Deltaproteobacteria bacterium]
MTPTPSSSSPSAASATSSTPTRSSRRLVLQFVLPTLAALGAALATAIPYVALTVERHQIETLGERLLAEARVAGEALPWTAGAPLDVACAQLAADLGVRLTVIAADGRVLGESTRSSESLENHADRPEVKDALTMGRGQAVRHSATVGALLLYTAWLQTRADAVRVVRTALPLTAVAENVAHLRRLLVIGLLAAMLLGLATSLVLSRRVLRRIQRLVAFARAVAGGAPAPYLAPERRDDLGVLEAQLAEMAREVAATIAALRVERERLEAILRGMVEGVLVTDLVGRVALMNERARELLGLPAGLDGAGRSLVEVARQPQVSEMLRGLAGGETVLSRDLMLEGAERTTLQVNGARLCGPDGQPFGYVLVLHDVTELRRLEVVRRDFVANVSHELRTPVTAIKGYAETLLGPAGDDREARRRFLSVIDRHSERLGRLIDDLLTLSDLELGRSPLRLGTVAVAPAVEDALQILSDTAARGGVELGAQVDPASPALEADADRFRQVLINLVDNAIKYTPGGGRVFVRAAASGAEHDGMVEIAVEDTGVGIPARDLPRLTERFFRVDKGRSRALGGTGLGLAIVKHIVQAHGGELGITSAVGRGTTVRVLWPAAAPARPAAEVAR